MTSPAFWKAAAERAIRTVAQTAIAVIGVDMVNVINLDWPYIAGVSATAGVLSILTSLVAAPVGEPGPSFGTEVER